MFLDSQELEDLIDISSNWLSVGVARLVVCIIKTSINIMDYKLSVYHNYLYIL